MYKEAAKALKQNTVVIESTFSKIGLKVVSFNIIGYEDDRGDFFIELSSIEDTPLTSEFGTIKVVLYDGDGDILEIYYEPFYASCFLGYDAYVLGITKENFREAKSARILINGERMM